jgi:pimeloyl-ACP methyl ester carboxylesterase
LATPKLTSAQKLAINYYRAKLNLINIISPRLAAHQAFDLFTKPYGSPRKRKSNAKEKPELLSLFSEGQKMSGYRWRAKPDNEKKLLIIHGFAGSVTAFDRYLIPFQRTGYDVYAYDAPGHGGSGGNRLNVKIYVSLIKTIIKTHGPFDGYMAHSLGGLALMIALHELAMKDRPKVALIAPATESTSAADKFFEFLQLPESLRNAFEKHIERLGGMPLEWYSVSRVLEETSAQILWLHDEDDATTPIGDVYPLLEKNPAHVHFYITKGLGHSSIYRDNKVKRKILDFFEPMEGLSNEGNLEES